MPGRDADPRTRSRNETIGPPVRGAPNPRAPGADLREQRYPVPAFDLQRGLALGTLAREWLVAALVSWVAAGIAAVLLVLGRFPR